RRRWARRVLQLRRPRPPPLRPRRPGGGGARRRHPGGPGQRPPAGPGATSVSAGIVHFLFVGAFLFAAGGVLLARRAGVTASLAAIPLMLGGAGVDLAAVSR